MNDDVRIEPRPGENERLRVLHWVLGAFPRHEDPPDVAEVIAYSEWVMTGSISAATALIGQRHALYSNSVRPEES